MAWPRWPLPLGLALFAWPLRALAQSLGPDAAIAVAEAPTIVEVPAAPAVVGLLGFGILALALWLARRRQGKAVLPPAIRRPSSGPQ